MLLVLKAAKGEKRKVPSVRAMKAELETGVKSDTPFYSRLPIEKTNSGMGYLASARYLTLNIFLKAFQIHLPFPRVFRSSFYPFPSFQWALLRSPVFCGRCC